MAEIINLNRARKIRDRAEDKAQAAANRVAHGRTKGQKNVVQTEQARATQILDGQKLDGQKRED